MKQSLGLHLNILVDGDLNHHIPPFTEVVE